MSGSKTREEIVRWVDEQLASAERGMTEGNVGKATVAVQLRRDEDPTTGVKVIHKDYVRDLRASASSGASFSIE